MAADTHPAAGSAELREAASRVVAKALGYGKGPTDFDLWHAHMSSWVKCVAAADAVLALAAPPKVEAPALREALLNYVGLFDNAIYRRRLKDDALYAETVRAGRAALGLESDLGSAALSAPPPGSPVSDTAGEALRQIKHVALTAGAPGELPAAQAFSRIIRLCIDAGVTDKLPDLPAPSQGCDRPPEGWECSREPGHEGPCAASPAPSAGVPAPGAGEETSAAGGLTAEEEHGAPDLPVGSPAWCSMMQTSVREARSAAHRLAREAGAAARRSGAGGEPAVRVEGE